jgi:hypothetical protein
LSFPYQTNTGKNRFSDVHYSGAFARIEPSVVTEESFNRGHISYDILSTFEQLHRNKMDVFERGIINVFKGLSWDYKTNSPCRFGKKIIVNNLVTHSRWGFSLNWGWRRDQLADLERMLFLLDGKPIPDNRGDVTTRLMEHIRDNPSKDVYEDDFFSIRYFQKGTAHITFKRYDLTEKMNDIVAKHYPGMLAEKL